MQELQALRTSTSKEAAGRFFLCPPVNRADGRGILDNSTSKPSRISSPFRSFCLQAVRTICRVCSPLIEPAWYVAIYCFMKPEPSIKCGFPTPAACAFCRLLYIAVTQASELRNQTAPFEIFDVHLKYSHDVAPPPPATTCVENYTNTGLHPPELSLIVGLLARIDKETRIQSILNSFSSKLRHHRGHRDLPNIDIAIHRLRHGCHRHLEHISSSTPSLVKPRSIAAAARGSSPPAVVKS